MDQYIGIIVKNQWDNILLHDGNFYIKAKLKENKDIKSIIKEEIFDNLDKDIFKIKKVYAEKLEHKYETLTMYLVEVGVYSNDFEFLNIDKLINELYSFQDKEFYERNILKPEEYTTVVSSIFNLIMLIAIVYILPIIKPYLNLQLFFIGILCLAISFIVFKNIIGPKIAKKILNFNFNTKIVNSLVIIMIIIFCIKLIK